MTARRQGTAYGRRTVLVGLGALVAGAGVGGGTLAYPHIDTARPVDLNAFRGSRRVFEAFAAGEPVRW